MRAQIVVLAILGSLLPLSVSAGDSGVTVVELFTSEGCSSCPSADVVLSELRERDDVAILGWHVDYWDKLGWTDRFGHPEATRRQRHYAKINGTGRMYTPQMIVNGQAEFVGSDSLRGKRTLEEAANIEKIALTLNFYLRDGTFICEYDVTAIPESIDASDATSCLVLTEDNLVSDVTAGENSGRTLQHDGVVRAFFDKSFSETAYDRIARIRVHDDWKKGDLKAVVFIQDNTTGHILGAAVARLAE